MDYASGTILTTNPSELSAFNINDSLSRWRVQLWEDSPVEVRMQQIENDAQLITFMNKLPRASREWTNPIMRYSIDTRPDYSTTLSADYTPGTTIYVTDYEMLVAGSVLYLPQTGQTMLVTAKPTSTTVTVDVTKLGGVNVAATKGDVVLVGPPYMGELSELRASYTTVPGEPQYNYITMAGIYFAMSKMQLNSAMATNFGTLPKEMENIKFQLLQSVQSALLFANRSTWYDNDEAQFYIGNGLLAQLQQHTLDLGTLGNKATWANFNDFFEPQFESRLSAMKKDMFVGSALFRDLLNTARTVNRVELNPEGKTTYYSPDLGSLTYDITTDSGKKISVHEEKWSLKDLSDWGFVLDSNNLGAGQYKGLGPQWFMNLQSASEVMKVKHGFFMSWAINVFDDSTMGVVRGGTQPIVNR
jgi:hypothetical protein